MVRQAVEERAAPGDLQPDTVARAQAEQAPSITRASAATPVRHPSP
jgi:hypothetical protein